MVTMTPNARNHEGLAALASRYVDVDQLAWTPTCWPGIELKVLMEDKQTGLLTALTRFAPGAVLPDHEHTEIEQTYVIEGSLVDGEGEAKAGQYVWRPAGSRHDAHSPGGCVVLSFFLKPNKFFDRV
jgi:anti-sigma factor ChrR (cupin superfamily)